MCVSHTWIELQNDNSTSRKFAHSLAKKPSASPWSTSWLQAQHRRGHPRDSELSAQTLWLARAHAASCHPPMTSINLDALKPWNTQIEKDTTSSLHRYSKLSTSLKNLVISQWRQQQQLHCNLTWPVPWPCPVLVISGSILRLASLRFPRFPASVPCASVAKQG